MFTYTGGPGSTEVQERRHARSAHGDHAQRPAAPERLRARRATASASSDHDTKVQDFFDEDEIKRVYYPEMEALVKAESGAKRVVVFDHTLRTADDALTARRSKIREVVRRAHNDYTEWSGPQRVRDLLPDEADELLKRRFAIIQVWRPIRHPVETHPLAICDARSVSPDDFVISERRYPNRIGQTYVDHLQSGAPVVLAAAHARATRRWCSRSTIRRRTAARAGPPTPPSTIRPRRRTRGRARASKSARWRFSRVGSTVPIAAARPLPTPTGCAIVHSVAVAMQLGLRGHR